MFVTGYNPGTPPPPWLGYLVMWTVLIGTAAVVVILTVRCVYY